MNKVDKLFAENIEKILENGSNDFYESVRPVYSDGTPSHTKFITQVVEKYDISKGEFPITNLRHIGWKSAIKEILWIYQDQSNELSVLKEKYNIHWWDEWNVGDNTIGQRYGATVRRYNLVNKLLVNLKNRPYGRRHIIDLYQYKDFEETDGLYPCAFQTLWSVRKKGDIEYLDLTLIQRSNDYLVAGHINKIQYTALLLMISKHLGYKPGMFMHLVQNLHIYDRHIEQALDLIRRYEKNPSLPMPRLYLNTDKTNFYEFTIDDFVLDGYEPLKPQLKFDLGI